MNDPETAVLIELIYAIRQRGVTVLLIEHDMGLVMKVCEKLLVLEYGSLIASGFRPTSCAAILKLLKPIWAG